MKHLLRFKTFLLMAVLSLLAGTSAWAESDPFYTLDTTTEAARTSSNSYAGTGTVTLNGIEWTVNGNGQMYPWRLGGKSISNTDRTVNTNTAMGSAINKVVLTVGTANYITVNSLKLTVASDADFSNVLDEVTATFTASSDITFEPSTGTEWATGAYYKFTFNVSVSGTSNKFVQFSGVKFYAPESTGSNPSISADNVDIEYNATAGEIIYSVNNPATGGFLSASTTASWLTVGTVGETVPFTCDANDGIERTATVTLTYTYGSESVSKNVLVTQAGNPNGPGTENNPYTVAQARAAIDAGSGTQGVYATGIVSEIITAYGYNNYSNITFNIVTQDGDSEFLQAFRCVSSTNADASTIAVGDIVVVSGNLTKYNTTYEFAQGCQVVSITHPAVSVEAPTFSPAAGTYADAQSVTISTATDGATVYYTTDGTEPTDASTPYTKEINISTTTTLKAIAYKGGESSTVATATYYICSAANPYTVTEALAFPEYPANGVYVQGIVSTAPTQTPTSNGQLTYYISVDGQATDQLQVYKGLGLNQATFTAQDDIQVGDEVTIYGNVKIYNSTKEFDTGNYLVAFNRPVVATPSITITPDTYEMDAKAGGGVLPVVCENLASDPELAVVFVEADGTTPATYDWITATINDNGNIDGQITANTGDARTAYFKVSGKAADGSTVYSNLVTFTQQAAATEPYITVNTGEVNFEATGGEKTLSFDYENLGSNPVFSIQYFESDGTTESSCGWISYQFDPNDNKVTINGQNNDEDAARTAYFKIYAEVNKTKIYSNLVTVNQAAPAVPVTGDYVKVTSTNDLTDGEYLIVYEDGNLAFDGNLTTLDASSNTVAVTIDNNTIASTTAVDAATFTIDVTAGTIQSASGYYIGQTSDANGLKASNTEAYTNTMSIDADGNAVILASGGAYLRYNATSGQERFRYFKSSTYSSQKAIALYKKSSSPAPTTPSITLPDGYEFNVNAAGGDNELTVTCSNMPADPQLAVVFCDANGDAVADDTYDWITAVINANGNIDGHIDANTGDARTAYFKVSGKDADDNTIYSNLVTINQAAPAAPSIVFNPASIDFEANAGNKTIGGDYFQLKDFDSTPSLEILFYESDGETSAAYDWITASFNADGKIDLVYNENTGAARTAYLKIHAVGTTVYSNLFTINQAAYVAPALTQINLTKTLVFDTDCGLASGGYAVNDELTELSGTFEGDASATRFGGFVIKDSYINGGSIQMKAKTGSIAFPAIESEYGFDVTVAYKTNDAIVYISGVSSTEASSGIANLIIATGDKYCQITSITLTPKTSEVPPTVDVEEPVITEVDGLITIIPGSDNAQVIYTTDGTDPTYEPLNGTVYTEPFNITVDTTIKVIGVDADGNASDVVEWAVTAPVVSGVKYYKVTSIDQLEEGVDYLLVYEGEAGEGAAAYGGLNSYTKDSYGKSEALKHIAGGVVTITDEEVVPVTLKSRSEDGTKWAMRDATGWIAAINGNNLHGNKSEDDAVWTFDFTAEAHKQIYHEFSGNTDTRYLEYNTNNPRFAGYTGTQSAVYLYKAASYNVSVGATGYATLYYGTKNLVVPENVEAYTYTVNNGKLEESYLYGANEVIPAGTGVVLKAPAGEYKFAVTTEAGLEDTDNLLFGFDEPSTTVAPAAGDYLFYLLGVDNGKVGFYWGKDNGAAFTSGAHKAYLAVPAEKAGGVRAFYFDDTTTGIDTLNLNVENENAYDLQGRRVQQLQKGGLYIVDGKKMLAK